MGISRLGFSLAGNLSFVPEIGWPESLEGVMIGFKYEICFYFQISFLHGLLGIKVFLIYKKHQFCLLASVYFEF